MDHGEIAWQLPRVEMRSTNSQECSMGINNDQVKGRADEAAGKVKEVVGKVGRFVLNNTIPVNG